MAEAVASSKRSRKGALLSDASAAAVQPKALRFSPQFSSNDLRLLKLPKPLAAQLKSQLQTGEKSGMRLVGEEGMEAVLCTDSETYAVVRVETSNDVLLVPPAAEGDVHAFEVTARCKYYYELKRVKPSITRLMECLQGTEYFGDGSSTPASLVTHSELEAKAQMSRQELDALLRKLHVVVVDGHLRILDFRAICTAIDVILSTIVAKDMGLNQLAVDAVLEECPSLNRIVAQEALRSLSSSQSDAPVCALDAEKVARACAHLVFTSGADLSQRWDPEEFLTLWNARLPGGVPNDPALLKGIALREVAGGKEFWTYFPRSRLSKQEEVRFQELFQRRARWELDDLEPYLRDLVEDEAEQAKVLLTYTRSISDLDTSSTKRYIVAK